MRAKEQDVLNLKKKHSRSVELQISAKKKLQSLLEEKEYNSRFMSKEHQIPNLFS